MIDYDLVIRGGTLFNHNGEGLGDVAVRDGKIVAIGDLSAASAGEVIDAKGRLYTVSMFKPGRGAMGTPADAAFDRLLASFRLT